MTTSSTVESKKEAVTEGASRTRSPGYPAFGLKSSLEKAKSIYEHEKRNAASVTALAADWGLNAKSSSTLLAVSSLKKFGLLEEVDGGKERGLKLSQVALNILLNDQEDSPERIGLLKQCALTPKIHAALWKQYNGELPSDANLKRHLIMERNFNDSSVEGFIKQFKDTISFAKLSNSDKITITEIEDSETEEMMKNGQNLEQKTTNLSQLVGLAGDAVGKATASATMSVLREFTVPLSVGTIALRLPYPMDEEDFQLFLDTLKLWKRQLVKKPAAKTVDEIFQEIENRNKSEQAQKALPEPPFVATWKNKDFDKIVKIVGWMGEKDGKKFYKSEDGTGIPASEIFPKL